MTRSPPHRSWLLHDPQRRGPGQPESGASAHASPCPGCPTSSPTLGSVPCGHRADHPFGGSSCAECTLTPMTSRGPPGGRQTQAWREPWPAQVGRASGHHEAMACETKVPTVRPFLKSCCSCITSLSSWTLTVYTKNGHRCPCSGRWKWKSTSLSNVPDDMQSPHPSPGIFKHTPYPRGRIRSVWASRVGRGLAFCSGRPDAGSSAWRRTRLGLGHRRPSLGPITRRGPGGPASLSPQLVNKPETQRSPGQASQGYHDNRVVSMTTLQQATRR